MKDTKVKLSVIIISIVLMGIILTTTIVLFFIRNNVNNNSIATNGLNKNENVGNNEINNTKKTLSKMVYQDEMFDLTNPIPIKVNGKYGYIDTKGNIIIEPKFEYGWDFIGKYALVTIKEDDSSSNTLNCLIDRNGNIQNIANMSEVNINNVNYGAYLIGGKLYNLDLEQISPDSMKVESSYGEEGYFTYSIPEKEKEEDEYGLIKYKDEYGIINSLGEIVYSTDKRIGVQYLENMALEEDILED